MEPAYESIYDRGTCPFFKVLFEYPKKNQLGMRQVLARKASISDAERKRYVHHVDCYPGMPMHTRTRARAHAHARMRTRTRARAHARVHTHTDQPCFNIQVIVTYML